MDLDVCTFLAERPIASLAAYGTPAIMGKDEREQQVLLSLNLGPLFPLYGVVALSSGVFVCECGDETCEKQGKHPRSRGYRKRASSDRERVKQWLQQFPHANFGVLTGPTTIALDVDVRANSNGLLTLEWLEIDEGQRIPHTVEVITGRNNGSKHIFFKSPSHAQVRSRVKALPGLDVRAEGGYCVAAGSRHICGGYYAFAPECRPDEQLVAEMPDFVLAALAESSPKTVALGPDRPCTALAALSDSLPAPPQETLPDGVVLGVMRRDAVARFYWHGGRRNHSRSEDDFALACKLAFYCRHDLEQMYRLFLRSGLYRSKFEESRPGGNYALWTLKRAIATTPAKWVRTKRKRPSTATGAKKGRRTSLDTIAILDLRNREPGLTRADIAVRLGLPVRQVRDAIYYHGRNVTENAWTLIHSKRILQESLSNSGSGSADRVA